MLTLSYDSWPLKTLINLMIFVGSLTVDTRSESPNKECGYKTLYSNVFLKSFVDLTHTHYFVTNLIITFISLIHLKPSRRNLATRVLLS